MKENLPHKIIYILPVIVLTLIPLGVVFVVNVAYKANIAYLTLWRPADTLAFCGAYLSFAGTVILGSIAVYQNRKAQVINEQLQKLQQVKYVSMVSAISVTIETIDSETLESTDDEIPSNNVIDLGTKGFTSEKCYFIDVVFRNDSDYPIVQMKTHPGKRNDLTCQIYGMKNIDDRAVYITKDKPVRYRYVVPCIIFEYGNRCELSLCIDFINVFDYKTPAKLHILDLQNRDKRNEYQFRLSKFIDIKPPG